MIFSLEKAEKRNEKRFVLSLIAIIVFAVLFLAAAFLIVFLSSYPKRILFCVIGTAICVLLSWLWLGHFLADFLPSIHGRAFLKSLANGEKKTLISDEIAAGEEETLFRHLSFQKIVIGGRVLYAFGEPFSSDWVKGKNMKAVYIDRYLISLEVEE